MLALMLCIYSWSPTANGGYVLVGLFSTSPHMISATLALGYEFHTQPNHFTRHHSMNVPVHLAPLNGPLNTISVDIIQHFAAPEYRYKLTMGVIQVHL